MRSGYNVTYKHQSSIKGLYSALLEGSQAGVCILKKPDSVLPLYSMVLPTNVFWAELLKSEIARNFKSENFRKALLAFISESLSKISAIFLQALWD